MADPRTCPHEHSQPVDVRDHTTGATETVARICTACLEQLPTAWGCSDCSWVDVRALCDPGPRLMLGQPCGVHA